MTRHQRHARGILAASMLLAGCTVRAPGLDGVSSGPIQITPRAASLTVPLKLPALRDRNVQYLYNSNDINTVEVRLRDSLGNQSAQYVARNPFVAGSANAGTVNVSFYNVMPGTFTLTVRTSHQALVGTSGPIKYDGLRDVFYLDGAGPTPNAFDSNEPQMRLIAGISSSAYLVFAPENLDPNWAFPTALRTDSTTTQAGYGAGAATQSILAGQTSTVSVNVGQLPHWPMSLLSTVQEVTAGSRVSLPVADIPDVQALDGVMLSDPSGFSLSNGIADLGSASISVYGMGPDPVSSTVSFVPTRATNPSINQAPTPWNLYLLRGQAASEVGLNANNPQLTVVPDLVSQANSRFFGSVANLSPATSTTVAYDLRDAYGNLVAGNVPGSNMVPLSSVRRNNAGLGLDDTVVASTYGADPTTGGYPFILPGRTAGSLAGGVYTQGTTPPGPVTTAATYSVGGSVTDLRITRLEVPYYLYAANPSTFTTFPHVYTLNVANDPTNGTNLWVSLALGGVTIASSSINSTLTLKSVTLNAPGLATGILPPAVSPINAPVVLAFPSRQVSLGDSGATFTLPNVASYGVRRVSDVDTVRARVLNNRLPLFTSDVPFAWQP